jgi:GcrA cell cycle regulator
MGGAKMTWEPERVCRLELLVQSGVYSYSEIGQAMGITKNQAIGKAQRSGITGPRSKGPTKPAPEPHRQAEFPPADCCVFPLGHPRQPGFHFCCAKIEGVGPYCPTHHKLAYRPAGSADD